MFITLALALCSTLTVFAQGETQDSLQTPKQLEGTWIIDLRPTADAEPYLKKFILILESKSSFSGEFYDSLIFNGRINENWDKMYFAFKTEDQSSEYFHSGYMLDGKIYGITHCPNRNFVAPWVGVKE